MNARDTLLLTYEHLYDGQTVAGELCPACGGGETKERSLSVSRKDGLLVWKCHRASCGMFGYGAASGRSNTKGSSQVPQCRGVVGRTILRTSEALDEDTKQTLRQRWGITEDHIRRNELSWDPDTARLCLPVQNFLGERLGVNLRALDNRQPKTKLHAEDNAISWHVNHITPDIIIVEDQLSAIRASDYLTSVALLGTHLNQERVDEIKKHARGRVFLALDRDAWDKTISYTVKYRSQIHFIPVQIKKDIKDMSEYELKELMAGLGV